MERRKFIKNLAIGLLAVGVAPDSLIADLTNTGISKSFPVSMTYSNGEVFKQMMTITEKGNGIWVLKSAESETDKQEMVVNFDPCEAEELRELI